ncbi:WXG100 family type VII secretion target [Aquihabitans sp. McL0605]|uniref:WXG100 family type VII secretion target n=1 Tax=Aquihabitans sp. McL0605 TaxID=3415671 RepID=UPI003CEBF98D
MGSFKVDPDQLAKVASSFSDQASAIKKVKSKLEDHASNLPHDIGGGNAANAARSAIADSKDALDNLSKSLASFAKALDTASTNMATAEKKSTE